MDDKKVLLINILRKSSAPVTGKQLATQMNCSPRSVINYVNQINSTSQSQVIRSSQEGYSLNPGAMVETVEDDIPQNKSQRMIYILKLLMLSGENGIDAFDLADELMISYSLLKKEISDFNSTLKPFNISIISRNNCLYVKGNERDKRKTVTALIHKFQGDNFIDLETLKEYFDPEMIETIRKVINYNIKRFNAYVNDFSMLNLILHLAIITNRLQAGETLEEEPQAKTEPIENNIADHIIREVEYRMHIQLNKTEYAQMAALIKAHVHLDSDRSEIDSTEAANKDLFSFVAYLANQIKEIFYLDFTNDDFLIPFSLHIQNLIIRLQKNIQIDNPLRDTIRNTAPFLYDVAMYVMQSICDKYDITTEISDNEFTFIVMHLALEVERQKQSDNSVKVLLYLPRYLGLEKDLPGKIQSRFDDVMKIVAIVSVEEDISKYDYDVLISFVNATVPVNKRFVKVNPILKQADYNELSDVFTLIQQEKLVSGFHNLFPFFFEKENFIVQEDNSIDKYEAIKIISKKLEKNDYVGERFESRAVERERAISTGYLNFAVPHGVSHSVLTQTVGVMIIPGGMNWDEKTVYCVLLMAVNPEALNQFQEMYNALLLLLLETDCVEKLRNVKTFEQFREVLLTTQVEL